MCCLRPKRDYATLVRGIDRHGHFTPEPVPHADLDPDAVAAHREILARHTALLMSDMPANAKRRGGSAKAWLK